MDNSANIVRSIEQVLQSGEPISFYDALMIIRRARYTGELTDEALASLIALHDCQRTTDGAHQICAAFLTSYAERMARQRQLAGRPVTLADSGNLARAAAGSSLRLELEENVAEGFRWEIVKASGPIRLTRAGRIEAATPTVAIVVKLLHRGHAKLRLEEQRPTIADVEENRRSKARHFDLDILIE
jgi:hypothetical protein